MIRVTVMRIPIVRRDASDEQLIHLRIPLPPIANPGRAVPVGDLRPVSRGPSARLEVFLTFDAAGPGARARDREYRAGQYRMIRMISLSVNDTE